MIHFIRRYSGFQPGLQKFNVKLIVPVLPVRTVRTGTIVPVQKIFLYNVFSHIKMEIPVRSYRYDRTVRTGSTGSTGTINLTLNKHYY